MPRARVISRCTADMESIDEALPTSMEGVLQTIVTLSVSLIAVVFIAGWQALVLGSIIAVTGSFCANIYLRAQLCVKRENSNAKSPGMVVLLHFLTCYLLVSRCGSAIAFPHDFGRDW